MRYSLGLSRRLGMGLKRMAREIDSEEIAYQMAYDLVEHDDREARQRGLPTPDEVRMTSPRRHLSMNDPDLFEKLDRFWPPVA